LQATVICSLTRSWVRSHRLTLQYLSLMLASFEWSVKFDHSAVTTTERTSTLCVVGVVVSSCSSQWCGRSASNVTMAVDRVTVISCFMLICLSVRCHATCPIHCLCSTSSQSLSNSDTGAHPGIAVTCSDADLTSMPSELPSNAAVLDVSGNRLEVLDRASLPHTGVHHLSTANFSRNRIVTIATESFSRWSKLVNLDLSANRLSSIDHGTFRGAPQTTLQFLDLSGNRLTDVDGGFSGMTNLFRSVTSSHET